MFDTEKSGSIPTTQLKYVMIALGYHLNPQELAEFEKEVDADGSGDIDFEEFTSMMTQKMKEMDVKEELEKAFKSLDTSKCGLVCITDLLGILNGVGYKVEQKEIIEMLTEHDQDRDGYLTHAEFMRTMMGL